MPNHQRIKLIILIFEVGLPCFQAARMLKIPYTNAKVIYRGYKTDKKVFSHHKRLNMQRFDEERSRLEFDRLRE